MTRLSLNVVVYNEEARLEECLLDARDHVDEIVVVDQMSTDRTPEIAARLADVYVRDVHHGHAEPSRELAAARSSGEWILVLDADETMSDLLKGEVRRLIAGHADGYWIQKENFVGSDRTGTVLHFRLFRKSRVWFDPGPHGGARAVADNVERFEQVGIVHRKSLAEQIVDDARYDRLALEDDAPTSSKRNWLAHNHALRQQRRQRRRADVERLLPAGAARILIAGDIHIELRDLAVHRLDPADLPGGRPDQDAVAPGGSDGESFDAAVVALAGDNPLAMAEAVAGLVRPGGVLAGTVPASRNRRRLEQLLAAVMSGDTVVSELAAGGTTRRHLLDTLAGAGLDVRWMGLVRDRWLDPVALRPDGSGAVVESEEFLLKRVNAEVAEELTAEEIVFSAVASDGRKAPGCSVVVAAPAGSRPQPCAEALLEAAGRHGYEVIVALAGADGAAPPGVTWVAVAEGATMAACWNAGARAAAGELLAFVSSDTMPSGTWLDTAIEAFRSRPDTGAVGAKVVGEDGTVEHAGLVFGPDRIPYRVYQGEPVWAGQVNRPRIMPAVAADGMVTSRARFVEVGGFDEDLGEDLADADFCLRLRARGLPILYSPRSVLQSSPHAAPGARGRFRRSAREFAARWPGPAPRSDEVVCATDGCDVGRQWGASWRLPRPAHLRVGGLPGVAWTSHFFEHGGYTEEALATVEALDDAGLHVVATPLAWDRRPAPLPAAKAQRLAAIVERDLPEDFVHVAHVGADRFKRHPAAMRNIGRTMFETDGLPALWRDRCNAMDEIWVPSKHNLRTFAAAGVAVSKLHLVPETFDRQIFHPGVAPLELDGVKGFVFLSLFSWIDRKGWDLLLRAWFDEFATQDDVTLLIKTDAHNAPPGTNCQREVASFIRHQLQRDPSKGGRVIVHDRPLDATDMPRLYRAADAFVLASHGEGWGRPYMEAMAMGLPTIATRWSGNLEFMDDDNSYLVGYELIDAPGDSWRRGQRWAQPSYRDLRRTLRRVYEHREEAAATGARARADVLVTCRPELVAEAVRERVEAADRHPVLAAHDRVAGVGPAAGVGRPGGVRRLSREGRRLTACVVASGDGDVAMLPQCLASLDDVADQVVVVQAEPDQDGSAVRNQALDQARGGWVLMLDAVHTLDPDSIDQVRHLANLDRFVAYAARELHQFGLDGAVSAVEERTPVLFPRHPDLRYTGRVAEQLMAQRPGLDFHLAPGPVVLYRHRPPEDPVTMARRQLAALEGAVREQPHQPFHHYNLGSALLRLGLYAEAEVALRLAHKLAPPGAIWAPPTLAALSQAVSAQGRKREAVKLSKAATKKAPNWPHGWCRLGEALIEVGRVEPALQAFLRALDCEDDPWLAVGDPADASWHVRAAIGKIHLGRGEYLAAMHWLGGALASYPASTDLRVWLARACETEGQGGRAQELLEGAAADAQGGPEAHLRLGDFFNGKAEAVLVRGLADHAENRQLLERIERLRAAQAMM